VPGARPCIPRAAGSSGGSAEAHTYRHGPQRVKPAASRGFEQLSGVVEVEGLDGVGARDWHLDESGDVAREQVVPYRPLQRDAKYGMKLADRAGTEPLVTLRVQQAADVRCGQPVESLRPDKGNDVATAEQLVRLVRGGPQVPLGRVGQPASQVAGDRLPGDRGSDALLRLAQQRGQLRG